MLSKCLSVFSVTYVVVCVCVCMCGVVVTAICTSKSELEFNVLSARRYVSMAQRKFVVGWGLKPTLGADNRATSEQINKRVRESAHTGNFARAWRGRRGPCNPLKQRTRQAF